MFLLDSLLIVDGTLVKLNCANHSTEENCSAHYNGAKLGRRFRAPEADVTETNWTQLPERRPVIHVPRTRRLHSVFLSPPPKYYLLSSLSSKFAICCIPARVHFPSVASGVVRLPARTFSRPRMANSFDSLTP